MKKIALLGATGSIGTQTLKVARLHPEFSIVSMAANRNADSLEKAAREFLPKVVCCYEENAATDLKNRLRDTDIRVVSGMDGLIECATLSEADIVVGAVVGMIGILPTMEAIKAKKDIAIANKETLVTAGHIITRLAEENHVRLLPVDSEHSAIFQCLQGEKKEEVSRILLTASGGPFRTFTKEELRNVKKEDALKHPNWNMGPKVTIDSSTLFNKGLEVMEAHWLFSMDYDQIDVVIQPESIIHSMVEFRDGAIKAQMGVPDMCIPIQYALDFPNRATKVSPSIDFTKLASIHFETPDTDRFPGLRLAYEVGKKGGNAPTVFNAANEVAVGKFLRDEISYPEIFELVSRCVDTIPFRDDPTLTDILNTETETRDFFLSK